MPDSPEPYNLSLFSSGCLVATGMFEPHIHKDEAKHVRFPCDNPYRASMITCKTSYKDEFVAEVRGLSLDIALKAVDVSLPSYIPGLDRRLDLLPSSTIQSPVVALTLVDVLRSGVKYSAG